jgi:hypothetical protein
MKKILLIVIPVLFSFSMKGQVAPVPTVNAKTIFESDKMVWYGLDFTKARMIGMSEESPSEIKESLFRQWNEVILDQPEKFAIGRFFRKISVYKDPTVVEKRNKKVDTDAIMSYNEKEITKEDISAMIHDYVNGDKAEGLGLVFIVESFNKGSRLATVHVTFFDIASKRVLLSKRVSGKPGGFGMRNYWINAIFNIMEKIDEHEYRSWKDEFGG